MSRWQDMPQTMDSTCPSMGLTVLHWRARSGGVAVVGTSMDTSRRGAPFVAAEVPVGAPPWGFPIVAHVAEVFPGIVFTTSRTPSSRYPHPLGDVPGRRPLFSRHGAPDCRAPPC